MEERKIKVLSHTGNNAALHVIPGHFATSHSHINYYIDITTIKTRASEAIQAAKILVSHYQMTTVVDTIVCMDGTDVIGAFMAEEFQARGFYNQNQHDTIYVIRPEFSSDNQMMFRDNMTSSLWRKNIILLMSSTTTGLTVRHCMDCIQYYGGILQGISSVFSIIDEVDNIKINTIFDREDVPDYVAYKREECPMCASGHRVEAMVNGFGYSRL